jgi:hypothetical protein
MTAAVDNWPAAARFVTIAAAGQLPLHHSSGHNLRQARRAHDVIKRAARYSFARTRVGR